MDIDDGLYLVQNIFPTLIGLVILGAYYYFGAHSDQIICCIDDKDINDENTTVNLRETTKEQT